MSIPKQLIAAWQVIQQALGDWWYSWILLMMLNTLMALAWITVIFGPPATFALYYTVHSLGKTNSTDWHEFIAGARRYFFISWGWMLLNIAVVFLLRISIEFYSQFIETTALLVLVLAIGGVWFCVQFYALPFMMEQEQKNLLLALRNGLLTLLASPFYTFGLVIFVVLLLWISLNIPILLIMGCPSLLSVLGTGAVRERLDTFNRYRAEQSNAEAQV